ncbi:helix-turn-helix domain-containing protein [Candidatus Bandiella euplotis]|uniref:DNA-binding response regulator n=1 Tax=Candidatus Bandiella euplotis TaxID=1664265 RepID=A0ABZ0UJV9_9RICK|nr:helix-turn-helix domain-containing protein [Candidatus Bandiella woodruffii]WPX96396.1 Putative DNA-binding response regulator [Candidatus Bandiella woodruffii]
MITILSDSDYIEYALKTVGIYKTLEISTINCLDNRGDLESSVVIVDDKPIDLESLPTFILIAHHKNANLQKPFHISALMQMLNQKLESLSNYIYPDNFSFFFYKRLLLNKYGQSSNLTEKEANLLRYLLKNNNSLVSKSVILQEIWQYKFNTETTTLQTHLYSLKSKFKDLQICDTIEIQTDKVKIKAF